MVRPPGPRPIEGGFVLPAGMLNTDEEGTTIGGETGAGTFSPCGYSEETPWNGSIGSIHWTEKDAVAGLSVSFRTVGADPETAGGVKAKVVRAGNPAFVTEADSIFGALVPGGVAAANQGIPPHGLRPVVLGPRWDQFENLAMGISRPRMDGIDRFRWAPAIIG